ncbi:MAG: hypothetical protein EHM28_09565, partial [Spirochaetaceae bacterium]
MAIIRKKLSNISNGTNGNDDALDMENGSDIDDSGKSGAKRVLKKRAVKVQLIKEGDNNGAESVEEKSPDSAGSGKEETPAPEVKKSFYTNGQNNSYGDAAASIVGDSENRLNINDLSRKSVEELREIAVKLEINQETLINLKKQD